MANFEIDNFLTLFVHHGVNSAIDLAFLSKSVYRNWQKKQLLPVINDRWQQEKAAVLADLLDRNSVTLLGDERCDSPGYSAKYGIYTMMDKESEKIVVVSDDV